jgi:ribosomal-protein-alanine N-acetyltransferase
MIDFVLRPWRLDDIDSLVKYANNPRIAQYMTDGFTHPYTIETGMAFIAFATKDTPIHIFAIEVNREAVGGIGIHPQSDIFRKNAEIGYWLAEEFWGHGIITRAIIEITDFAFKTYDITRVFARTFESNKASQRVLEKAGYIIEGRFEQTIYKNGAFQNEIVYAKRK